MKWPKKSHGRPSIRNYPTTLAEPSTSTIAPFTRHGRTCTCLPLRPTPLFSIDPMRLPQSKHKTQSSHAPPAPGRPSMGPAKQDNFQTGHMTLKAIGLLGGMRHLIKE